MHCIEDYSVYFTSIVRNHRVEVEECYDIGWGTEMSTEFDHLRMQCPDHAIDLSLHTSSQISRAYCR